MRTLRQEPEVGNEQPADSFDPPREALKAGAKALLSPSTGVAILVGVGIAFGVHHASETDIAGPVLAGNMTLVALILPAAALSNDFLENRLIGYVGRLEIPTQADATAINNVIGKRAAQVVDALEPLLKGFTFLIVSLILSIAALFQLNAGIYAGLRLQDLLLGLALGLDLIGILLLFPFSWLLLNRELAERTRDLIASNPPAQVKTTRTSAATGARSKPQGS